ncbi:HAD family phosphatase [Cetobacterium sp. 2A]|uniref:Cof-type HAD-IIB family hydrolase n=1 Tax=unclassified Cetobacterium TaxID=2630983 RepID=UPI00163C509D|nr:Cof-type HAD-IIB family hydrolase [Cetobacterium sp. 2A]MBC2855515.1 HAD family phosphatase [Cetobacterium sp. 2A]
MKIKAVALDLDGTLLSSDKTISLENLEVLEELEKRGILIFISTGRPYISAKKIADEIGLKSVIITYNGAKVINPITGEVLYEQVLEEKYVKKLIEFSREFGIHLNLYQNEEWFVENDSNEETIAYKKLTKLTPIKKDFDTFELYTMTKTLFIGENHILKELEKKIKNFAGENVHVTFSQSRFLEILNKNVNKGAALLAVLEKKNIKPEECMAFGDASNDLEMLKVVGYGVAMGNATDEVKAETSYITDSNDDNGVANFIKKNIFKII